MCVIHRLWVCLIHIQWVCVMHRQWVYLTVLLVMRYADSWYV